MATFSEAFAALDDFRLALLEAQQSENLEAGTRTFSARGAFSAFATALLNVHATGIGIRLRGGKIVVDDFVIKVYVFEKQDLEKKHIPKILQGAFQGIGIDVEHLPVQQALPEPGSPAESQAVTSPAQHQQRLRPIVGGVQISPFGEQFVGTLGCLVKRGSNLFALSNNHVLADTNRLPIGTQIVQAFGTKPADIFAQLSDFETIQFPSRVSTPRNRMDAAIAAVRSPGNVRTGKILGISNYSPVLLSPRPGMVVTKAGRTTGVTHGSITAIRVNGVKVNYGTLSAPIIATFDNCVQIKGPDGQSFSAPGDSGSVILENGTGRPVALLFAGNTVSTTACDLTAVCSRFNVIPA